MSTPSPPPPYVDPEMAQRVAFALSVTEYLQNQPQGAGRGMPSSSGTQSAAVGRGNITGSGNVAGIANLNMPFPMGTPLPPIVGNNSADVPPRMNGTLPSIPGDNTANMLHNMPGPFDALPAVAGGYRIAGRLNTTPPSGPLPPIADGYHIAGRPNVGTSSRPQPSVAAGSSANGMPPTMAEPLAPVTGVYRIAGRSNVTLPTGLLPTVAGSNGVSTRPNAPLSWGPMTQAVGSNGTATRSSVTSSSDPLNPVAGSNNTAGMTSSMASPPNPVPAASGGYRIAGRPNLTSSVGALIPNNLSGMTPDMHDPLLSATGSGNIVGGSIFGPQSGPSAQSNIPNTPNLTPKIVNIIKAGVEEATRGQTTGGDSGLVLYCVPDYQSCLTIFSELKLVLPTTQIGVVLPMEAEMMTMGVFEHLMTNETIADIRQRKGYPFPDNHPVSLGTRAKEMMAGPDPGGPNRLVEEWEVMQG